MNPPYWLVWSQQALFRTILKLKYLTLVTGTVFILSMTICVILESYACCKILLTCHLPTVICGKKSTVVLMNCTFVIIPGKVVRSCITLMFSKLSILLPILWLLSKLFVGFLVTKRFWTVWARPIFISCFTGLLLDVTVILSVVISLTENHCFPMPRLCMTNSNIWPVLWLDHILFNKCNTQTHNFRYVVYEMSI